MNNPDHRSKEVALMVGFVCVVIHTNYNAPWVYDGINGMFDLMLHVGGHLLTEQHRH